MTCLAVGVVLIAIRLGQRPQVVNNINTLIPTSPPSDAEIARLHLLSTRIDTMQYNLANADTVAFKRQRVIVGDGVQPKVEETKLDMTQGQLEYTRQPTDLAIQGEGFFHVKIRPTVADGTAYTRNGMLHRNENGDLVVALGDGWPLIPPINIPNGAMHLDIQSDGTITYQPRGSAKIVQAGQLQLCRFANPQELNRDGDVFTETYVSGRPIIAAPGEDDTGTICQGYLESCNVDPLKEWAGLLRAQKMMQFSNQTAQVNGKSLDASILKNNATQTIAPGY